MAVAAGAALVPMSSCEDMVEEGASDLVGVGGISEEPFRVLGDHIPYNVVDTWAEILHSGRCPVLLHTQFPLHYCVDGVQSEGDKAVAAVGRGVQGAECRVARVCVGRIAD